MGFNVGLFFAMIFIVSCLITFIYQARKRGWMRWHECKDARAAGSYLLDVKWLFVMRLVITLYAFGIWCDIWTNDAQGLVYYTVWSYTLLNAYFMLATYHSFQAMRRGDVLLTSPSRLNKFTCVLFQIVFTTCLLVDVVLWGILLPNQKKNHPEQCCGQFYNFSSYNVHGVNLLLICVDFIFSRHEITPAHAVYCVIYPLVFGVFSWIYHAAGGKWVYFFLDTSAKAAGAWYLGLCALHLMFFLVIWIVGKVKRFLVAKYFPVELAEETSQVGDSSSLLPKAIQVA